MNTTLTVILAGLLGGAAITQFNASDVEEQTAANVASLTASQLDQAVELSKLYGYDHTPSQAWDRWYSNN